MDDSLKQGGLRSPKQLDPISITHLSPILKITYE